MITFTVKKQKLTEDMAGLVRSSLQKDIRRGRTEHAIHQGLRLLDHDSEYFWRTLAVIAFEDVGVVNLKPVAQAAKAARFKKYRGDSISQKIKAKDLISRLSGGEKCRAACELSFGWDLRLTADKSSVRIAENSDAELQEWIEERDIDDIYRALLVVFGRSRAFGMHARVPSRPKIRKWLREWMGGVLSGDELELAVDSTYLTFDTMPLAIISLLLHGAKDYLGPAYNEVPSYHSQKQIKGFFPDTYDMHTEIGKKALAQFYVKANGAHKELKELARVCNNPISKSLGAALFVAEGGLLNLRRDLPGYKEFMEKEFLSAYGVPPALQPDILGIMDNELLALNGIREGLLCGP